MYIDVDIDNAQALLSSLRSCADRRLELPEVPVPSPGLSRFTTAAGMAISGLDRRQEEFRAELKHLIDTVHRQLAEVIQTDHNHSHLLGRVQR